MDAVHPEDREHVVAACHKYVQEPEAHEIEQQYRRVDGEYLWYLVTGTSIFSRPMAALTIGLESAPTLMINIRPYTKAVKVCR